MNIVGYTAICKKHRKLLITSIIVILISTLYSPQLAAIQISVPQNINEDYDGYIIKFNEEPLSISVQRFRDKIKNILIPVSEAILDKILVRKSLEYKEKILFEHKKAKEDILELVENDGYSEGIFSREFTVLFNGLTVKKIPDSVLENSIYQKR